MIENVNGERQIGMVKWWDDVRGYGFIKRADGAGDVFTHFRDLEMVPEGRGRRNLQKGQRVSFVIALDDHGRKQAREVREELEYAVPEEA